MKKYSALLIVLALLCCAMPALCETEEKTPQGEWYASLGELVIELDFDEDGGYALKLPGKDPETGAWVYDDGYVILDGNTLRPLNLVNAQLLIWTDRELFFRRERPWQYAPAPDWADAEIERYSGYWVSEYILKAGQALHVSSLRERTDLFVDGMLVALGGVRFRDVWWNFVFEDGCLKAEFSSGETVTLTLQQDGYLRLDIGGEEPATLWLSSASTPEDAEEESVE